MGSEAVHVVAAVIRDPEGKVLLTRRPDHVHLGGLWEFPGGKMEPGESVAQALRRELHEELGIDPIDSQPLIHVPFVYPEKKVLLDVWQVATYRGAPVGKENQLMAWVDPKRLNEWEMPAADLPIVTAICLPDRYLITPDPGAAWDDFLRRLQTVLENGIRLVQLRAKQIPESRYRELAREVIGLCREWRAEILLNHAPRLVEELGADGVHLPSDRLWKYEERPLPTSFYVAASCHSLPELERAVQLGVDFAVLGAVQPTTSHPDVAPLGWERFQAWVNAVPLPVYALGGMTPADIGKSRESGGQGIATISSLWG